MHVYACVCCVLSVTFRMCMCLLLSICTVAVCGSIMDVFHDCLSALKLLFVVYICSLQMNHFISTRTAGLWWSEQIHLN